jgi:Fe-S-cluster containining protein
MSKDRKAKTRRRQGPAVGRAPDGPLGQVLERTGLLDEVSAATRELIEMAVGQADEVGRTHLRVVSCHRCTAPKACCKLTTIAYLHEGVAIADRLIREGRDTPELRAELAAAADAMEATPRDDYGRLGRACVFLDEGERCTVYGDRPSACGMALVYSPPEACSDPGTAKVERFSSRLDEEVLPRAEEAFRAALGLPRRDHVYVGVLPRMVLLCLEAWVRTDYAALLAAGARPAAHALARVMGAAG